jgi:hypothetical protein
MVDRLMIAATQAGAAWGEGESLGQLIEEYQAVSNGEGGSGTADDFDRAVGEGF